MARPTLYDPAYCDAVIEHMAEGASLTSFAATIRVSRDTISQWMAVHEEFSVSANIGKALCASWWEKVNRGIARNGGGTGSAQACALGLKNMARDDWVVRSEVDVNVKGELADRLASARQRVAEGRDGNEA